MSRLDHPIAQEELMAYLDGELATDRAVEAAAHLERCTECQELAAELKKISQKMMAWEIEPPAPAGIPADITVALEKPRKQSKTVSSWKMWGIRITRTRLAWTGGIAACLLLAAGVSVLNMPSYQPQTRTRKDAVNAKLMAPQNPTDNYVNHGFVAGNEEAYSTPSAPGSGTVGKLVKETERAPGYQDVKEGDHTLDLPNTPMIVRTVGLTLITNEFEKTRSALDDVLKRHSGYMGELNVSAPSGTGRTLTATLRIPARQLDSALSELKKLGRVENESQSGEEVTQQYLDLAARLSNAQHTEQRLTEILRSRTGKLQDVLKVELEIDRVRGEIEQMQAEKKELSKRVAFATLNTTVKEEYQAKLQGAPASTFSRFHNAAVDGYNSVVEGLISVGLFLLSSGPSLLIWAAILFFPVRWIWRKVRAELKKNHVHEVS